MKWFGRILAVFLILIIVPLFIAAACNMAFTRTMINPETYRDAFENQDVFNDLLPVALPAIVRAAGTPDGNTHLEEMSSAVSLKAIVDTLEGDRDTLREVTNLLIPPVWLENQFDQMIDILFGMFRGDFSVLETPMDLAEIRNRLMGESAQDAARLILDAAPECTRTQTDIIRTIASGGTDELPICKPGNASLYTVSYSILVAWFNATGERLPAETVAFASFWNISHDSARVLNLFVELDFQFTSLTYLCPLGLLSLVVFFAVRSLKGFSWWAGTTAIAAGIGVLLMLLLLRIIFASIITTAPGINELDAFMQQILSSISLSVLAQSSTLLLLQAAVFIGIGFVLLAIAWLMRTPHVATGSVIITDDGQIISTVSRQRSKAMPLNDDSDY